MRADLPPATSASQLIAYAMCPRIYWYRYVAQREPEFRSLALVTGSAVHGAVGFWHERRKDNGHPTVQEAEQVLRAELHAETVVGPIAWQGETLASVTDDALGLLRL